MQIKIKMFLIGLQADTLELEHPYLKGTHYKPSFTTMENNDVESLHLNTFQRDLCSQREQISWTSLPPGHWGS